MCFVSAPCLMSVGFINFISVLAYSFSGHILYRQFSTKYSEEPVQALDTELLGLFILFPHEIKMI